MSLVVLGLGNPGTAYQKHRHNLGFRVVDLLAEECGISLRQMGFINRFAFGSGTFKGRPIFLAKPLTFMNRSGEVVKVILRQANASADDLLVIFDSLDLPVASLRLKAQGSAGGHRGLNSVLESLKTERVARLAIGIGRPAYKSQVIDYVLSDPSPEEEILLTRACAMSVHYILRLLTEPFGRVMADVNKRKMLLDEKKGQGLS